MRIYLFLESRLFEFKLPKDISGSYSFDYNIDDESKLINIEARNGIWVLYSTNDSNILDSNNIMIKETPLESGKYYYLTKSNKTYLMYAESNLDTKAFAYDYREKVQMNIGNTDNCNIQYKYSINKNIEVKIYKQDEIFIVEKVSENVYLNNIAVNSSARINCGDKINIYGLELMFIQNMVIISYIDTKLMVFEERAGLARHTFNELEEPKNIEIKDIDLYNKNNYFSKSPRLRRSIETKKIKFDAPPSSAKDQELPMILVVGPMITMGATSVITLISTMTRIGSGQGTWQDQWPTILTCVIMLISMLIWPIVTQWYNKRTKEKRRLETIEKYNKYLTEKKQELANIEKLQRDIINENLLTVPMCLEILQQRKLHFWDKRIDQNDFLVARIGIGDEKLNIEVEWPEEGFTIDENELRKNADKVLEEYKYIKNVPLSYSFYENRITAIMGTQERTNNFINNIILQLITFYSYEDLKIVVFTNEENKSNWNYIKYLNHSFTNDRRFRFYATDSETAKEVLEYLNFEINNRKATYSDKEPPKPHYLIIVDDYSKVKRHEFIQTATESEDNLGFNIIIKENMLKNLPSKCDNFITLNEGKSGILKNSYENQEQIEFNAEITYNINMMNIAKILSNIPIEFENGMSSIPDSISFLEMEKVGKVEQLNILNRWNANDSTISLRAEIGVNEQEDLIYLDLHEKQHGPHGLIAGTTGSGKSEFIITYILSMCVNYSPDDISFILIDYKGGGLALAFENKTTNTILPHLAGTITNLDKAEMDRTLVSINSEAQRRQKMFNEARDKLGESTMDIYKYQKHFHEGRLSEPIPHLFIICDEFAELKSQQPEFMDDLISIARIGRSLGVHLILATQKPSGVVNDQIWSNSRFKVCLKVQDEADSKEMLKKPDAAYIKQAGRFYLQVGYDEYYVLGQSGWCGAKYYPSDKIVKSVDKSINFINDYGGYIKNIQASTGNKIKAQGEQLANILNNIIEVSKLTNKKTRRLWLENISNIILEDDLVKKYAVTSTPYMIESIIGEYDAPEKQEQGLVKYNLLKDGNTAIYGNDGGEREFLLNTIIYSTTKNHTAEEINYYILDYGSESLRKYSKLPHLGGIVFAGEEEKYNNLFKFIKEEITERKRMFSDYGGEYINYIKDSGKKLPLIAIILNNYDSIYEANPLLYDELPDLVRDSERYGIIFIITANAINSISNKVSQSIKNIYAFKLKDSSDYLSLFDTRTKLVPSETLGRGLVKIENVYEFQTASITNEEDTNSYIKEFVEQQIKINKTRARGIPTLPKFVRWNDIQSSMNNLTNIPIGISKNNLEIITMDFLSNIGNIITSIKLANTKIFVLSLISLFKLFKNNTLIIIDGSKTLSLDKNIYQNYYDNNYENVLDNINQNIEKLINEKSSINGIIIINSISKMLSKLEDTSKLEKLTTNLKKYEHIGLIIVDEASKIKQYNYDNWFTGTFNIGNGIWIGRGVSDQNLLQLSSITKEMTKNIKNDMGYAIIDNLGTLIKLIDFISKEEEDIDE